MVGELNMFVRKPFDNFALISKAYKLNLRCVEARIQHIMQGNYSSKA